MFHADRHRKKHKHPASPADDYVCDHPDCQEKGQYPAPKSRDNLHNYLFFCLYHVRQYNKNWNYYEGMDTAQIDAERDADIIGHRPLRPSPPSPLPPFSTGFASHNLPYHNLYRDEEKKAWEQEKEYRQYDSKTRSALQLLQVTPPVNWQSIKTAYKFLAKQFHPDSTNSANTRHAQDKMKSINQAYAILKLAFCQKTD